MNEFKNDFLENCIMRIQENSEKISSCLNEINYEEIWKRPNPSSNSIANIILHLCGNIRQYAISSLGQQPDVREREKEFATSSGYSKEELLARLISTVDEAKSIIQHCSETELLRIRSVQGFNMSGIGIIIHVTEHYSYHTGQVIFWTKVLKNKDLGFYAGTDLNQKNIN